MTIDGNGPKRVGRRRAIRLLAVAAGVGFVPLAGQGRAARPARASSLPEPFVWRGVALGAEASIALYHPDRAAAERLVGEAVAEVRRLEAVFSLYRPDSALSRLNRTGVLAAPPLDLVRLLATARAFGELTGGAFDVTVQPLWELYARHFAARDADPAGPDPAAVGRALSLVDYRRISVASDRIALGAPGMAVTLNGIAQGYITDRVADLLRAAGVERVLLDLGEIRGIGRHPEGRPWRAGIRDPGDAARIAKRVDLDDRALASSAGSGTPFDGSGRIHHLFDPASGRSANRYAGVSVLAPTATAADALSTGLSAMPRERLDSLRGRLRSVTAIFFHRDGRVTTWES